MMYTVLTSFRSANPSDWGDYRSEINVFGRANAEYIAEQFSKCVNVNGVDVMDAMTGEIVWQSLKIN